MHSPLGTTLAAALAFSGLSIAVPAPIPMSAPDTWVITFCNLTTTGPHDLSGENPKAITFGPGDLNKCVPLGNTLTRFVNSAVSQNLHVPENCMKFFGNGKCTGAVTGTPNLIGAIELGGHCLVVGR
jgi:hypothetical protein